MSPITTHLFTLLIIGPKSSTARRESSVIRYRDRITCQHFEYERSVFDSTKYKRYPTIIKTNCLLTIEVSVKVPSGSIVVDNRAISPIIEMTILGINILSSMLKFFFCLPKNGCTTLYYFFFLMNAGTSNGSLLSTSKSRDDFSFSEDSFSSDISNSRPLDFFSLEGTSSS